MQCPSYIFFERLFAFHLLDQAKQPAFGCYGEGIRRITATRLYFKAENWRLDMSEISVYPALIYLTPWISG